MRSRARLLIVLAALAPACGGAPGGAAPAGDPPRRGTATPAPDPDRERREAEARRKIEAWLEVQDADAHRVMATFAERVFDPMRDAGLAAAAGAVDLEVDGRRGAWTFTFDASRKSGDQVALTDVRADDGLHAGAAAQARRFVVFGVRGGYSQAVPYAPPGRWAASKAADGAILVVMPEYRRTMSATYRFDAAGLVDVLGVTEADRILRTKFHWMPHGRWATLVRSIEDDGKAVTSYEYERRGDLPLLVRASLVDGIHRVAATLVWTRVERR